MSLTDDFREIVAHLIAPTRYHGFYPYQIIGFTGPRPDIRALDPEAPPLKAVDRVPGFAGAVEDLPLNTVVLVGFRGGKASGPFVAFTLETVPNAITVNIAPLGTRMSVQASGVAVALAKNGALNNYFTALETYLAAIVAALPVPGAVAGATATFTAAASAAKSAMPTTRLYAE